MAEIAMSHPNVPGEIAHATQEAFDQVWARKGWEVVDEPTEEAPDVDVAPKVEAASVVQQDPKKTEDHSS